MATISINATTNATTERPGALRRRLSVVPWSTVVPVAVVMAYADGFWLISLRLTAGSIERTGEPFASWLRESTLTLPVFVLAVLGALALAARWFGPVLRRPKTAVATALLVVAAGTLVGIALLAASSAFDYRLQASHLQQIGSMPGMSMGSGAQQQQASLGLQVRAVGFGSGIMLVTNLVLVGWVVALRGSQLDVLKKTQ